MASENGTTVIVEHLTKRFAATVALDDFSLEIERGITFGLLGPNGSGKTTLIRVLTGLVVPTSGHARVLGHDPRELPLKNRIGYMTQQPALYADLTVRENLDFFARIYGLGKSDRRARIDEAIAFVELEAKRNEPVAALSGGMRQRLSLACALIHRPEVVFLDEPTVGVDPGLRRIFWRHFKQLNRDGVTIIVSSHVMDEASRCDRLGLLSNGRLLAQGDLAALLRQAGRDNLEDAFIDLAREEL